MARGYDKIPLIISFWYAINSRFFLSPFIQVNRGKIESNAIDNVLHKQQRNR